MHTFAQKAKAAQQNSHSKSMMPSRSRLGHSRDIASHNAGHSFDFANIPILARDPSSLDIVLNSELPDRERVLAVTLDHTIHVSPNASRLSKPRLNQLLAHESVHVAQQNLRGRLGTRSELEHEANALAPLVLAGRPFRPLISAPPATALRDELTIGTDSADQQLWVSRVDDIVRDRFGLTSVRSRLTDPGRVEFQDVETFARGFGSAPRDLLFEAFAEGLGEIVSKIQDFYSLPVASDTPEAQARIREFIDSHINSGFLYWNHYALGWADYGLTGISPATTFSWLDPVPGSPDMVDAMVMRWVTRAEAEAAASRQPGVRYVVADGRDWPTDPQQTQLVNFHLEVPLSRVTTRVTAGEILAQTYAGITSGGARGSRRVRISSTPARSAQPARPANVSTLVHEACHFYTHNNFNRFVDEVRSAGTIHRTPVTTTSISTMRLAPVLEEGFTEYFTRMVMQQHASTLGTPGTGAYRAQYDAASLIIGSMTPPSAAESAYFHGDAADIDKVRDGIQFVEQYPNTVRVLQEVGPDEIEEAFEGVRTPEPSTLPGSERLRLRTPEDAPEE